jgi:predicted dehydrogenase
MEKLRIALIGCGEQGAGTLLPCTLATPEATVTAVCDMDRARAQAVAEQWHIPAWFDDVAALLRAQVADALILATSPQGHVSILQEVLPKGLPVFVEKPAAVSLSALQPLLGLAPADSVTQVGHNLRFAPAILQLERALRSEQFGAPLLFSARYLASWPRGPRWGLEPLRAFLLTHFIHLVDLVTHLFGECVRVTPSTRMEPRSGAITVQLALTFADGLQAHLEATNAAPRFFLEMMAVGSGNVMARAIGLRRVEILAATDRERARVWEPGQFDGAHHLGGYRGEVESFVRCVRTLQPATPALDTARGVFAILQAIEDQAAVAYPDSKGGAA